MDFAQKLKRLREKEGMTQTDLAEELGLSLKTISRYEVNGMRPVSYTHLPSPRDVEESRMPSSA